MERITKRSLNVKGEAIQAASQALAGILKTIADLGRELDAGIAGGKNDDEFDVPANDPKLLARLGQIEWNYQKTATQFHQFDQLLNDLFLLAGQTSPISPASLAPGQAPAAAPPASTQPSTPAPPSPELPPASAGDSVGFAKFLTQVGDAVLNTQRNLDQKSQAYIAETANTGFAVPLAFRIPKLSGKMLFELELDSEKKVNLIFNSRSDKSIQRNQQEIDFDIVAVPAPPGAAASARRTAALDLVFDPAARAALQAANLAAGKENALPPEALDDPLRILILQAPDKDGSPHYLVIYAGAAAKPSAVGMWLLNPQGLQVIYPFLKTNSKFEERFKTFALAIAEAQDALLNPALK